MSFPVFCLFLILLQNRVTELVAEVTEENTEPTTGNTSSNSENTETSTFKEPTDSTISDSSTNSGKTDTALSSTLTTEGTTEDSNSNLRNIHNSTSTELTTELTTQVSNTISIVTTKVMPIIQSRALPDDVSTKPENKKSNEQQNISYEKNFATSSVFGIVIGSIVSTVAVFYITVSLITKYRRKSYTVRSPSIELGQA